MLSACIADDTTTFVKRTKVAIYQFPGLLKFMAFLHLKVLQVQQFVSNVTLIV